MKPCFAGPRPMDIPLSVTLRGWGCSSFTGGQNPWEYVRRTLLCLLHGPAGAGELAVSEMEGGKRLRRLRKNWRAVKSRRWGDQRGAASGAFELGTFL